MEAVFYRLADYEDTGLTPEQVAELARAKREGRCAVLPCKVGDTVYQLRAKRHARGPGVSPRIVSSAEVWGPDNYVLHHQGQVPCRSDELGKTWFLSEDEAVQALERAARP